MQTHVFLAVAVCALLAGARAEGDVVDLTDATFQETITKNTFVLVEFFAPWCGHCKQLAPEYAKAATALKEYGVVLAAVDSTVHQQVGTPYDIKGFPTLKFFKNGVVSDYNGGRTESKIINWILKAIDAPPKQLLDSAAVTAFASKSKAAVVGFFPEGSADISAFTDAAKADDTLFALCSNANAAKDLNVPFPSVVVFKSFDNTPSVLTAPFEATKIADFVGAEKSPTVIPFTMEAAQEIFQSKTGQIAFLFSTTENADFVAVAQEFRGKFVFVTSDGSIQRLNDHVGVSSSNFPQFIILTTDGQLKRYPYTGPLTADGMKGHVNAFLSKSLKASLKSEAPPATNDGPVKIVVSSTFESIVLDPTKDVLLELYAPWCGHCKTLAPIYEELGAALSSNPNIVIAKMDGTQNEVDGVSVKGFPTLKFYPAGANKTPAGVEYQGGRDLQALKTYVLENAVGSTHKTEEL